MDEIALLRALAPRDEKPAGSARAAALQALESSFEQASGARPASFRDRHRGVLALAGVGALAAIVAAVLAFDSGPDAESATAKVLHQTAAIAASGASASGVPGPGQFLYMKTKNLDLEEWAPGQPTFGGVDEGRKSFFIALIRWQEESWMSAEQRSRQRLAMEPPQFLSSVERRRWEKSGSPLPVPFNDERGGGPAVHTIEARRGLQDVEDMEDHPFPNLSGLPREAKALRIEIEGRQAFEPIDAGQVIAELWDILDKPDTTPALRAAVFGALAEEPGIELDRNASDLVGRPGYALSYESPGSGGYGASQRTGIRVEYIFDPHTSEILGRRETITEAFPGLTRPPAGTVIREVAYLEAGVVDSNRERPHQHNGGPIATASSDHRK